MLNQNILQHYKGYELLVKQLQEAINRYNRNYTKSLLDFYNQDSIEVICSFLSDEVPYKLIGGYEDALCKRLVIGDDVIDNDYVICLKAHFNPKFNNLSHQDIKGAIYHLGIEPSNFGDFWIKDEYIYLYVKKEISNYIINNFTKVAHCSIRFEECEYQTQIFKFETLNIIVNSLRLDKIVAAIIRKSREIAKELISNEQIKVNYKIIEECSYMCNNYDILSIRRFGRFQIADIQLNKNGNYRMIVKKFV